MESQPAQLPNGLFQLLGAAEQPPRQLPPLARPEINLLVAMLTQWAHDVGEDFAEESDASSPGPAAETAAAVPRSLWRKARSWPGTDDIADDTPYGHPAAQAAASSAEKERLERVQRAAQAQVQQQLQAMEAREAVRERRIEELRTQLAQAPSVTTEAQALQERLAAESQEKAPSKPPFASPGPSLPPVIRSSTPKFSSWACLSTSSTPRPPRCPPWGPIGYPLIQCHSK